MVWMEPAALTSSVAPVFNDLDLLVVAFDGTSERTFYPNNLAARDPDNTVEMVVIPDVDSYEWFNVSTRERNIYNRKYILMKQIDRYPEIDLRRLILS